MKYCSNLILLLFLLINSFHLNAKPVSIGKSNLVGKGIVEFIPVGFDQTKTPSLILKEEPVSIGNVPGEWSLVPIFSTINGKANASINVPANTSLYGGGEVTGPLLRNGKTIKLWNTDSGAYGVDNGSRLYQSHPWVMGVRPDGTSFGIIFDSSWKAELTTNSDSIYFKTEGALFRMYIIDRESPQAVLKGLAELIGTIQMPPRWSLGYHQCRFSYGSEERVNEIADTMRLKKIPCDALWMDIDYMDGYRIFTFNPKTFPDPRALNDALRTKGFHSVWMIDPGAKVDENYSVYKSGTEKDVWVKTIDGAMFKGVAWPGDAAFPDYTQPRVREWWANLYKDFMAKGMDGIWNDVNEPSVGGDLQTMPYDNVHLGGGNLPKGSHLLYHNAYGRLMVEASRDGILAANPEKRPFILTRSNLLGGQRYAATWTGDNWAGWDHLKLSIPMSITLGLSGQPYSGPDIGGFLNNTTPEVFANWIGFGSLMPFARGHACAGTNNKEPWAFGPEIENSSRMALERRYRLLPYYYTLFHDAYKTGLPIMAPVFFADPSDASLRTEQQSFLVGKDMLVVPKWAENPISPKGIWEEFSLIDGDLADKYQAIIKIRGGAIIPAGKVIQNTNEKSFEPLTLIVCPDANGNASGEMYWDAGEGWAFECGEYGLYRFSATRTGNEITVKIAEKEGKTDYIGKNAVQVKVLVSGKVYQASGSLNKGIVVKL